MVGLNVVSGGPFFCWGRGLSCSSTEHVINTALHNGVVGSMFKVRITYTDNKFRLGKTNAFMIFLPQ